MKKLIAIVLCLSLLMTVVGCSSADESVEAGKADTTKATSANKDDEKEDAKEEPAEKITLELWTAATNPNDAGHATVLDTIDEYAALNPNIEIVHSAMPLDNLKQKTRTAAAGNELPDVFFGLSYKVAESMALSGLLLDLTPYIDDSMKTEVKPGALNASTYEGKNFGFPDNMWTTIMYYNTEIMEANGLEIPTSTDEIIAAAKVLQANGQKVMLSGGKQSNVMSELWQVLALRTAGKDMVLDLYAGKISADQPEFLAAAKVIESFASEGVFDDTMFNYNHPDASNVFAQGDYAMLWSNPGFIGLFNGETSKIADIVALEPMPEVSGAQNNLDINLGNNAGTWFVGASSEQKDAAVDLAKYLSVNISKKYYERGTTLSAWKNTGGDNSAQSAIYKQVDTYASSVTLVPTAAGYLEADATVTMSDISIQLAIGDITAEEYIELLGEIVGAQ